MVAVAFTTSLLKKKKLKKYHIIYKTTNLINGRFYIGMHSTNNLDDNYLGSGWILKEAIKKYGRENFQKEILFIFNTRLEAREKEAEIVNTDFIKDNSNYNLVIGGMGVLDQTGNKNPMWGKLPINAKKVRAEHKDGTVIIADSIQELSSLIHIERNNIRNLIKKGIVGKRGWKVECY